MGSAINEITSPFGFKLLPGGPYLDNGKYGQLEQQAAGFEQNLAQIIGQIAQQAGVTNPVTGQPGAFTNNPQGLNMQQQAEVNRQAGADTISYNRILDNVRSQLHAAGRSDAIPDAEMFLKTRLSGQLSGNRVTAGANAQQGRLQALQAISQLLGQGYSARADATAQAAQYAMKAKMFANQQLGNTLAMGMKAAGVGGFGSPTGGKNLPGTDMGGMYNYPAFNAGTDLFTPAQSVGIPDFIGGGMAGIGSGGGDFSAGASMFAPLTPNVPSIYGGT